ncbi:MAG: MBL fold metallo-hydrolase, partial [Candidatus Dadabacteria bacterium]
MQIGKFNVSSHILGYFRLDGGAMFGAVPKALWSRKIPADEDNCIRLAARVMLVEWDERKLLVDVGLGEKWGEKERKIFGINNVPQAEWGFDPDTITDIVITHLHFDHAGGISRWKEKNEGEIEPVFRNAKVFIQKNNLKAGESPNPRERASYLKENVSLLSMVECETLDGETEIYTGICVHPSSGHTEGLQWIEVKGDDRSVCYPADLIPTSHHLSLPYHMGYDMCTRRLLEEKKQLLDYAVETESIILFEHDPDIAACTVGLDDKGRYCVKE